MSELPGMGDLSDSRNAAEPGHETPFGPYLAEYRVAYCATRMRETRPNFSLFPCDVCQFGTLDFDSMTLRCDRGHPIVFKTPRESHQPWGYRPAHDHWCRHFTTEPGVVEANRRENPPNPETENEITETLKTPLVRFSRISSSRFSKIDDRRKPE